MPFLALMMQTAVTESVDKLTGQLTDSDPARAATTNQEHEETDSAQDLLQEVHYMKGKRK